MTNEYPGLAKLDALLRGEDKITLIRPPEPKKHRPHDYYAPRPQPATGNTWADMLGHEYFDEPEAPKPVVKQPVNHLYSIGQLAKVLGRQPVTIRSWILAGYMPEATHWTSGDKMSAKRRYSHAQVMGLLSIMSDLGMIENKRTQITREFTERVHNLWESVE